MEKELGTSPDIDLLLSIVNEIEKSISGAFYKRRNWISAFTDFRGKTITTKIYLEIL